MGFLPIPVDLTKRLDTLETQLGLLVELFKENNAMQKETLAIEHARNAMRNPPIAVVRPSADG